MRILVSFLIIAYLFGCNQPAPDCNCDNSTHGVNIDTTYEVEEFAALQDVTNDFLSRYVFQSIYSNLQLLGRESDLPDTIRSEIHISDALVPISQLKEDNDWMFKNDHYKGEDSVIVERLLNSSTFDSLGYREFDKSKFNLPLPFVQVQEKYEVSEEDNYYAFLSFSRISMDPDYKYGLIAISYQIGSEGFTFQGVHRCYLLKKEEGTWKYIPKYDKYQ